MPLVGGAENMQLGPFGLGCSFPGCGRHISKGDIIIRISDENGEVFVGRCEEHYSAEAKTLYDARGELKPADAT